jgi:hypothetical protein
VEPTLAALNARLSQAREAFHEALIVEHETLCGYSLRGSPDRKPVQMAHQRVLKTAEEYDEAAEAFSKVRVKRLSAAG